MINTETFESLLDSKEIKPVNPKANQSWIFIGRTDAEAGAPVLWPPDMKSLLFEKDPDAGKDWRQEEKGMTEDEMVGWHHWLNGHEFEQAPGDGEGQRSLAYCSPWGHRVRHDWVTKLNWMNFSVLLHFWTPEFLFGSSFYSFSLLIFSYCLGIISWFNLVFCLCSLLTHWEHLYAS